MTRPARPRSAATAVFTAVAAVVVFVVVVLATSLVLDAQQTARADAERLTRTVSATLAVAPGVASALQSGPAEATAVLQPMTEGLRRSTGVDFITIMTPGGIRVTHPDPAQIGKHYIGTIPRTAHSLTQQVTGTLGPSVRTIVPVLSAGAVVGWVSVGVTVQSISGGILPRLPFAITVAAAVLVAGLVVAAVARRTTRRLAGDLPAGGIRDAVASYESTRTLGEALRAQTHEHGNRMHTAVALIELGRADEAVEILTQTARQSQDLVDLVNANVDGDPAIGALLLGKAAQAREQGIDWTARIEPGTPASGLPPVDAVAVLGNLIDNALDAAAAGPAPRWVRVELEPSGDGVSLVVSDSGAGVPAELRERIFEHGFSTKPAGVEGRGVGLALARSVVTGAGGRLELDAAAPTTFRVELPGARR
ncbi:MAG TPA: ATP-binding protein [Microbacterium sp.]|uniref:sensor histidine kinase n=1 Tax=Microbacterium sp. TaxID=51671 RepID=UPI002B48AC3D|nr:ATP-binding protein [Microbacterium sp.]HKT55143.1 ATP-binding protein [Microbacterium sp.]